MDRGVQLSVLKFCGGDFGNWKDVFWEEKEDMFLKSRILDQVRNNGRTGM